MEPGPRSRVCAPLYHSVGELLVLGDQPGDPLEQRERPGMGAFAVHRPVLVERAGDGDERSGGGVEDHRFGVVVELVADDPVGQLGHRAQAAMLLGDARAGNWMRLLAAGCGDCWTSAISSRGSMFCWRAVRITLIAI